MKKPSWCSHLVKETGNKENKSKYIVLSMATSAMGKN